MREDLPAYDYRDFVKTHIVPFDNLVRGINDVIGAHVQLMST